MIEKLQKAIVTTIDRQIDPTIKELENAQPETYDKLDYSRDKFVSNLRNSVHNEIERFKTDFRIEMYVRIEKDIENKECKEIFENECEQGMKELDRTIEGRIKKCEEQFSKDIKEDIGQFEERIKDSLVMLDRINIDSGFDFSFNIDSGINKLGLFASIGGLVILGLVNIWNPMGWIELTLAGLLGLVGVVKSVWSFFDSDYKKSQQKKEVDKNLDKVCGIIEERVKNQIENGKKGASEMIENLKDGLNNPVVCYERIREGLIKAGESLWQIDNNIKTRIAQ
ncbi:hypothetical protein [Helicobacter pylori]|uniref:hypothetical protein n=1 Tax=Helicobacter pylori TaxID=210 RepID=UPI003F925620